MVGKPRVWGHPLRTVGPGSFIHDAIGRAGGKNIAASTKEAYPTCWEEMILEKDPDYYVVGSTGAEEVKRRPAYSHLKAVKRDRVAEIDADLTGRPGPRIAEGVREIAEAIHPEAFGKEAA